MDDLNRGSAAREHRESVSTSVRLSDVGDESNNDFSVVVIPRLDSVDSSAAGGGRPNHACLDDNSSLQRPSSVHSRPSSIAKPLSQSPPRTGSDVAPSETDLHGNPDFAVQADAPYEGPSNPSHPYQMYPQRAMSISTISATGPTPDGPYAGSSRPAHPYGLYPQSTPTADVAGPENIPVGFPGLTSAFPRRLGMDGDESGSLGGSVAHSEELPPYTRYPDDGVVPKASDPGPAIEGPSTHEARPAPAPHAGPFPDLAPIPGAGGIGLATRDPEFSSESSELGSPRLSTRSVTSDGSNHDIHTAASAASREKPKRRSWQQQATKRLWGVIPYWAVGLMGIVLILMGVILGAVIGTFLSNESESSERGKPNHPPVGEKSTKGVVLLKTVPPDLPDLETGTWGLLPLMVNQAPSTCFQIPDQSQAWTCNTPMNLYGVDVRRVDGAPPTSAYQLKLAPTKNSTLFSRYAWGTRSPAIPEHETLRLVRDPSEPGLGPAWWARREYNKTVVLPEDRISRSTESGGHERRNFLLDVVLASTERDEDEDASEEAHNDDDSRGKPGQPFPIPGAKEGDKAWICTWPDTVLEVFMYPGQNNTFNSHATESFSGFPGFPTPTESPSTSTVTDNHQTGEITSTSAPEPTGKANPTGPKSGPGWTIPKFPPLPPPYPQVVKVTERRVDGLAGADAYCEQVEIVDRGKNHRPVLDSKGQAIRIDIPERMRQGDPERREDWADADDLISRDRPPGECGCVWMVE